VSLSGPGLAALALLMLEQVETERGAVARPDPGGRSAVSGVAMGRRPGGTVARMPDRAQSRPRAMDPAPGWKGPPAGARQPITVLERTCHHGRVFAQAVNQLRKRLCVERVSRSWIVQEGGLAAMTAAGLELRRSVSVEEIASTARDLQQAEVQTSRLLCLEQPCS